MPAGVVEGGAGLLPPRALQGLGSAGGLGPVSPTVPPRYQAAKLPGG